MPRIDLAATLTDTRTRAHAEDTDPSVPMFARLTRKEARVREDQYAALSALARTLMRRRTVRAERITENTLIRVAIDFLLTHQHLLTGSTEEALRRSVTTGLTDSSTSAHRAGGGAIGEVS